eukprot:Nk52_evm28s2039 gene=Nk52_evmTU28s2039
MNVDTNEVEWNRIDRQFLNEQVRILSTPHSSSTLLASLADNPNVGESGARIPELFLEAVIKRVNRKLNGSIQLHLGKVSQGNVIKRVTDIRAADAKKNSENKENWEFPETWTPTIAEMEEYKEEELNNLIEAYTQDNIATYNVKVFLKKSEESLAQIQALERSMTGLVDTLKECHAMGLDSRSLKQKLAENQKLVEKLAALYDAKKSKRLRIEGDNEISGNEKKSAQNLLNQLQQ